MFLLTPPGVLSGVLSKLNDRGDKATWLLRREAVLLEMETGKSLLYRGLWVKFPLALPELREENLAFFFFF